MMMTALVIECRWRQPVTSEWRQILSSNCIYLSKSSVTPPPLALLLVRILNTYSTKVKLWPPLFRSELFYQNIAKPNAPNEPSTAEHPASFLPTTALPQLPMLPTIRTPSTGGKGPPASTKTGALSRQNLWVGSVRKNGCRQLGTLNTSIWIATSFKHWKLTIVSCQVNIFYLSSCMA